MLRDFNFGSSTSMIAARMMAKLAEQNTLPPEINLLSKKQQEKIVAEQFWHKAKIALMNGPKGTPPRPSTIRRFLRNVTKGEPATQRANLAFIVDGKKRYMHPTKGWRT